MKVLLVNKFHYKKGGSETYYFTLAQLLKARGHEVIFFSMKDEKRNIPCRQEKFFVSNASVQGKMKSRLKMVLHIAYSREAYEKMKKLLHEEEPDLVILNLVHKQITLSIIDAIKEYDRKLPIFWIMHDLMVACPSYTMLDGQGNICEKCMAGSFKPCVDNKCIKGSRLMSILSKYEADYIRKKKWYDMVDLFICPSDFYFRKLQEAKFTKRKIVMIRNPLPLDTVYEHNESDNGYILYFGRLSREKGVKKLIDAAEILQCRFVIIGTGPEETVLKKYADDISNVEFKGFQTGRILENFVRYSRAVVFPSEGCENAPYSAMEAMALGKPLIVSDKGGLPELVENGKNGYVYQSERGVGALAECIRKINRLTREEYRDMSECSQSKARKLFDPQQYIDELEKYYKEFRG